MSGRKPGRVKGLLLRHSETGVETNPERIGLPVASLRRERGGR